MANALRHRGPDGEGHWLTPDGCMGLAHRRLAVLDLSEAAAQPMSRGDRYTITYNGEIYNYLELREDLAARGHTFVSQSDTEVLLAAYEDEGPAMLERLDGMFAFAIWDRPERTLFCARDRFGEKPFFYWHEPGRRFVFASEMKALFAAGIRRHVSRRMLFHYLSYDTVEDPRRRDETFFEGVQRLEAAHLLEVRSDGTLSKKRYWALPRERQEITLERAAETFRGLFCDSVRNRLRSDVPLGSSLSGGIDSASVVCAIDRLRKGSAHPQKTFSARFDDPSLDEGRYIELVAQATDVSSHVTWPTARAMVHDLDAMLHHHEEPIGSASAVAQWEVMKLARSEGVTVLLDGQGADEMLGGYLHYFRPLFRALSRGNRRRLAAELGAFQAVHGRSFVLGPRFRLESVAPGLLRWLGSARRRLSRPPYLRHLDPEFADAYRNEPPPFEIFADLDQALRYSTEVYGLEKLLRLADRNSMAHSREVRLPFLSHRLVEFVFSLPDEHKLAGGWTKLLLRRAVEGMVPREIAWRVEKIGFEAPQQQWLRDAEVQRLVRAAEDRLVRERLIRPNIAGREWQWLMAGKLLEA
jgi:asparagine synthase (glutamine-hydrolysing)